MSKNLQTPECLCTECSRPQLKDPRASHEELIAFHNRDRRQYAQDQPPITLETSRAILEYMDLVQDDTDQLLFAHLEAERIGMMSFTLDIRKESTWRLR